MITKTSVEWQEEYKEDISIIDPDGWDRKNYDYSWNEELITEEEFWKRVYISTCQFSKKFLEKMK